MCSNNGVAANLVFLFVLFLFLTSAQMLINAIAQGGCTGLKVDWENNPSVSSLFKVFSHKTEKNPLHHRGLEPSSGLRLAFQSPVRLDLATVCYRMFVGPT